MKWFDRWLARRVKKVWEDEQTVNTIGIKAASLVDSDRLGDPALNFRMHRAETGWIMEVHRYDRKTDRNSRGMHIVNDSEDLGDSIAKIITMETLRS